MMTHRALVPRVPERDRRPRPAARATGRCTRCRCTTRRRCTCSCCRTSRWAPRTSSSTHRTATGSSTWSRRAARTASSPRPRCGSRLANRPDFATRDLSGLRKAYYGASIMPVPVLERLRERLPEARLLQLLRAERDRSAGHRPRPATSTRAAWTPADARSCFVEAKVVDEDGKDVPDGTPGEIVYRSPQLCEGYWDKPEETAEAFRDGWFRSGDLAVRDAHGLLHRRRPGQGRHQLRRRADRLPPGRGRALHPRPAVAEVAVIGLPDERWIEAVTAVVVAARRGHGGRNSSPTPARSSPTSRPRRGSCSWTNCRATRAGRSSSGSCGTASPRPDLRPAPRRR